MLMLKAFHMFLRSFYVNLWSLPNGNLSWTRYPTENNIEICGRNGKIPAVHIDMSDVHHQAHFLYVYLIAWEHFVFHILKQTSKNVTLDDVDAFGRKNCNGNCFFSKELPVCRFMGWSSHRPHCEVRLPSHSWYSRLVWFSVALRPQRRVGLLGTGTEWEGGERVKVSTAETARKRPERPWTAARTMEVLRRCPLAIAQRLVHCAIVLSTTVLDRVTKTMSVAPLLTNNLDNSKRKTSNLLSPAPPPYSWSLLGKSEGPAPPPSSKISWSFDLAWNPV